MKTHKEFTGYIGACCSPLSCPGVLINIVDKQGEISHKNKIAHTISLTDKQYVKLSNELGYEKYTAKVVNDIEITKI